MTSKYGAALVVFFGLVLAVPAMAHHGLGSEFSMNKPAAITGTLTDVEWENPHVYWSVDVKEANGTVSHWSVEGLPPSYLHRSHVERQDMLSLVGKQVTVHGRLAKDGSKLMFAMDFTLPDGRVIPVGPRAGDPNAQ